MITLIHGDHIEASRAAFNALKESAKGKDIRVLDGRTLELNVLVQSLESTSLFGGDTVVVIDRLFSKIGRQPKKIEELCSVLVRNSGIEVILWEDKEVGATVLKKLGPLVKIQVFKLPVLIFQFLDIIASESKKAALLTYEQLVVTEAPELVFSMIVKRIRQLIQLRSNTTPEGLAPWQIGRLTTQAKSFTMEKLLTMYKHLHDIEASIKTGNSPFPLSAHIEQFLLSL
jgi:DNA polymerase III delta subunit